MKRYVNETGKSSITHFEMGVDFIRIQYETYLIEYNTTTHSVIEVEEMKNLAVTGKGLSRYISKNSSKAQTEKKDTGIFKALKVKLSTLLF